MNNYIIQLKFLAETNIFSFSLFSVTKISSYLRDLSRNLANDDLTIFESLMPASIRGWAYLSHILFMLLSSWALLKLSRCAQLIFITLTNNHIGCRIFVRDYQFYELVNMKNKVQRGR